ncbi:MAG: hypothetical protein Q8L90_10785 [Bacteroidota bacterium]|nr:hypothetical protein [Bacteroidota bacterium]
MAKLLNSSQLQCNNRVTMTYFIKNGIETEISGVIKSIMDMHPNQQVYIGISCHPCGRYTGDYDRTTSLPTGFEIEVKHGEIDKPILEAHMYTYNNMYVIFSCNTLERIRELEIEAIECTKDYNIKQYINGNAGGGGRNAETESDTYFLYVCTSTNMLS